jgi:hypothetical protein
MSEIEHYMQAVSRLREDVRFLLSFVPPWAKEEPPEGMDPRFYGTLTAAGDREIVARVKAIQAQYETASD